MTQSLLQSKKRSIISFDIIAFEIESFFAKGLCSICEL